MVMLLDAAIASPDDGTDISSRTDAMQWRLFLTCAYGLGQAPAQQKVSSARDRLHGQQQGHQQIAADVNAPGTNGMTN